MALIAVGPAYAIPGEIDWDAASKIVAGDGAQNDQFGLVVAASGDYVVVGVWGDDESYADQSSAYIYKRSGGGWQLVKKLVAADGSAQDHFGYSVGISGDFCIIGAMFDDEASVGQGSAYVFGRNVGGPDNWGLVKKLVAADGSAEDHFGFSVGISGETCIIGATDDDETYVDQGSAYVFERNVGGPDNWGLVRKLINADGLGADVFGNTVAISGDACVVGAYGDDETYVEQGSAYVFERNAGGTNNWGLAKKLLAPDGQITDVFGWSVAISGQTCIVGALLDDEPDVPLHDSDQGAAYVFDRNVGGIGNWGFTRKLVAPDASVDDGFGNSVAITGDVCVVGANYDDETYSNQGAAYVFGRSVGGTGNWGFDRKLMAADGMQDDNFGRVVALTSDLCVVGVLLDDESYVNQGSIYIYSAPQTAVSGTIPTTTWTAANSPYRVTGAITVPAGNTLTIEPGVDVLFDADVQFVMQGKLNAIGTATDSIRFLKGTASEWGGIRISGGDSSTIAYTRISGGHAQGTEYPTDRGGGIYESGTGTRLALYRSVVSENKADNDGGGIFVIDYARLFLTDCEIRRNISGDMGAALDNRGGAISILRRCLVVNNRGNTGGIAAVAENGSAIVTLEHCTVVNNVGTNTTSIGGSIYGNTLQGVTGGVQITLINSIVWSVGVVPEVHSVFGASITAIYSDVRQPTGVMPGMGNKNEDPLFSDSTAGDYHLLVGSPCIDAGDPASPNDPDGSRADMGAFAFSQQNEPPPGVIDWEIVNKIVAGDGAQSDAFGISVAASGDYIIVGAYDDDETYVGQGSAYIYRRAGESWQFVKKLVVADGLRDDFFGYSVAISGDVCVVGAMYDDETYSNQGSAYIFGQNVGGPDNWGLVKKLVAADGLQDDAFGWSVAISGETCIVGASYDDETYSNQGSAYVFGRNVGGSDNWGLARKLVAPDGQAVDLFGYCVSISGDACVVGSLEHSGTYVDQGAAYVFGRNTGGLDNWGLVKELVAPDAQATDLFGYSVSISGDTCIVGAAGDDGTYADQGSAYVFGRNVGGSNNWGVVRKLVAPDGAVYDMFGWSVAIASGVCAVGSKFERDDLFYRGSVYIFGQNIGGADNWGFNRKLEAADGATADRYGYAVALTSDLGVVGAFGDDESYANQGSVYIYGTAGTSGGSYYTLAAPDVEVTPGETVVVPIMATTGTAISSADLVFRIDTTVVRPDPVAFVRSTPFAESAEIGWSITGDIVRVSLAVGLTDAYDFTNVPIVDLAFVTNPGISGTSPIAWLPYPETSMDEQPAALTDGRIVVRSIQYGDVNDDGDITAYDASLILKHVVRTISVSIDSVRADVTGNGRITSFDASHVLTRVVDASHVFPVELGGLAKPAPFVPPALSWLRDGGGWALVASDATGIEAGDLVFRLPDAGEARVSIDGPSAFNRTGDILRVAFVRPFGTKGTVLIRLDGVAEAPEVVEALLNEMPVTARPVSLSLSQNAPNPFNPETIIRYGLPATGHVELAIYDVTGRLVRMLVSDEMIAGAHEVVWNATDGAGRSVASGVYVYRLTSAQGTVVRRMTLVR